MVIMSLERPLDVGTCVRRQRLAAGLTETQLAEASGVSPRLVRQIEAGHPGADLDSFLTVLTAAGIELTPVSPQAVAQAQADINRAAADIRHELESGDEEFALRLLSDVFTSLRAHLAGRPLPTLRTPPSTSSERFDTLLRAGVRWAVGATVGSSRPWPAPEPLRSKWYPGDTFLPMSKDWIALTDRETPEALRSANIGIRSRSLMSA